MIALINISIINEIIPFLNAVAFLGGAGVAVVKIFTTPPRLLPRSYQIIYILIILAFSIIGTGYLLFSINAIDAMQLAYVNRPFVFITTLPAYIGFFMIDPATQRHWGEFRRQQDAMNEKISRLEAEMGVRDHSPVSEEDNER